MLVTAFEANEDVPKMKNVTNCLLHEERKLTERMVSDARRPKGQRLKCHHCGKFGHIRPNCSEWDKSKGGSNEKESRSAKVRVNGAEVRRRDSGSSDGDCVGLMVNHVSSASSAGGLNEWIVDSHLL